MGLKLEKRSQWLQVKKYLNEIFDIQVHIIDHHMSPKKILKRYTLQGILT